MLSISNWENGAPKSFLIAADERVPTKKGSNSVNFQDFMKMSLEHNVALAV
jgi:hypothetical protein